MQEGTIKSVFILGICILLGLVFLGYFLGSSLIKFKEYKRTVTVKGLSEKEYPADVALWPIHFSPSNNDLAKLYVSIEKYTVEIIDFLKDHGFEIQEITVSPPSIINKLSQGYEKSKKSEFQH